MYKTGFHTCKVVVLVIFYLPVAVVVVVAKPMFTLHVYQIAFAPARKPYQIGLLFTHKNSDFCNEAKLRRAVLDSGASHIG